MTWTPQRIARLIELRAAGMSFVKIGADLGVSRGAAGGKLQRLGLCKPHERAYRSRSKRSTQCVQSADWEIRLFEPYVAFKARRAKERADAR